MREAGGSVAVAEVVGRAGVAGARREEVEERATVLIGKVPVVSATARGYAGGALA